MRKILVGMTILFLCMGGMASAAILDFEDLYAGSETIIWPIESPYHGFTMSYMAAFITKGYHPGSGYAFGTTGYGSMFTANGNAISLSGMVFNVVQLDATSAWNTGEDATFQGWKDGALIYSTYVTGLSFTGPTTVILNYTDIDTLTIIPGNLGTSADIPVDSGIGAGQHLDIDNIVYNAVPLPPGLVLLGTGLLGLVGRRFLG